MGEEYERVLTVKPEVLVYRLPPRPSNRGYRAADWGLDKPSWTGRMRIIAKGNNVTIKLEDKISGELFAQAPVNSYPGVSVESVLDSSRYFILKISDESGKTAFIGIGFADRGDAFDFNVTLQDHFNSVKKDEEIQKNVNNQPALNLQLKEGQTFKINLGGKLGSKSTARPRTNAESSVGSILLPPPPGGVAKPPISHVAPKQQVPNTDLLGLNVNTSNLVQSNTQGGYSEWGEFESAGASAQSNDQGWVQF